MILLTENQLWQRLFDTILGLPFGWQIFMLLIITIVSLFILFAILRPFITDFVRTVRDTTKIFKKRPIRSTTKEPKTINGILEPYEIREKILNHRIMIEIKEIETKSITMNFGDKNRNKIFKFILLTQTKYIKENVMWLIDTYDIDRLDSDKFKRVVTSMINDIINDISLKLKAELGKEIYDLILLDPGRGMKTWSKHLDDNTHELIDEFCDVSYLEFNHQRLLFILTSLSTSLTIISDGIERRFCGFNGELNELLKKNEIHL